MKLLVATEALWIVYAALSLGLSTAEVVDNETAPEQIHLSFGSTTTEVVVMWSTRKPLATNSSLPERSHSGVRYGATSGQLDNVENAFFWQFTRGNSDGAQWVYRARLTVSSLSLQM